jgi:hypothetical protein
MPRSAHARLTMALSGPPVDARALPSLTAHLASLAQPADREDRCTLSDAPMCKGIKPLFLLKPLFELAGTPAKGARSRE